MVGNVMVCDAVSAPGRRAVLVALAGLAVHATPARADVEPALADLLTADGSASRLALSLAQSQVSLRGYLAPSLDGRRFELMEGSVAPCQLCGATHDAGASVTVLVADPDPSAPGSQRVRVSGRLEVEGGVRLVSARIQAV